MMKKEFKTLVSFVIYLFLPLLVSYIYLRVFNKPYTKDDINAVIWLNGVLDIVYFIIFVILSIDIFKQSNDVVLIYFGSDGNDIKFIMEHLDMRQCQLINH